MSIRMDPTTRKAVIIDAALKVARMKGIASLNYQSVAAHCEVATSAMTVRRYTGRIRDLQREVVRAARLSRHAGNAEIVKRGKELGLDD
jgi:DNA-binding transcriptional regulator YbjK